LATPIQPEEKKDATIIDTSSSKEKLEDTKEETAIDSLLNEKIVGRGIGMAL
jgi:hypothetical protein